MDLDFAADGNLRELSGKEACEIIENFAHDQKEWDNPPNIIFEQKIENLKVHAKRLFGNENVWIEMHRNIAWDKVENLNLQNTPQVPPSFEEATSLVTYPGEVDETIGTPIEVEPLNEIKLEKVGLNCNHNTPLSSREVPSPEPPIKPHSPNSSRIKVVDYLTTQTPPSPHVANSHPKGVDISNWDMFDDDWKLESEEVSLLGRGLNSPVRPKYVEKVIFEEKKLESS
ncbi:hypothetical protein Tco_1249979 [Tanacetum coccineum]